jgi:hypothetical protein
MAAAAGGISCGSIAFELSLDAGAVEVCAEFEFAPDFESPEFGCEPFDEALSELGLD